VTVPKASWSFSYHGQRKKILLFPLSILNRVYLQLLNPCNSHLLTLPPSISDVCRQLAKAGSDSAETLHTYAFKTLIYCAGRPPAKIRERVCNRFDTLSGMYTLRPAFEQQVMDNITSRSALVNKTLACSMLSKSFLREKSPWRVVPRLRTCSLDAHSGITFLPPLTTGWFGFFFPFLMLYDFKPQHPSRCTFGVRIDDAT